MTKPQNEQQYLTNHFYHIAVDLYSGTGADNIAFTEEDALKCYQEYKDFLESNGHEGCTTIYEYNLPDNVLPLCFEDFFDGAISDIEPCIHSKFYTPFVTI